MGKAQTPAKTPNRYLGLPRRHKKRARTLCTAVRPSLTDGKQTPTSGDGVERHAH